MTGPRKTISRIGAAFALMARADAIEAAAAADRIQPHSRTLPTETEMAVARGTAQQLRLLADEIRQGLEPVAEQEE